MDVLQLARELQASADLIVTDREGHSLLFVEVKVETRGRDPAIRLLQDRINRFGFPFGMLVDLESILIFQRDQADLLIQLSTLEMIQAYDPQFEADRRWISQVYLEAMAESWLADFGSFWCHPQPPFHASLLKIGLADRLIGSLVDVGGTNA